MPDPSRAPDNTTHAAAAGCADPAELEALRLINAYRAEHGLAPLVLSQTLTVAAERHSASMGDHDYSDHELISEQVAWWENIAAGHEGAAATFRQWQESPLHVANMLRANYAAIGIGRTYHPDAQYGWYWTTDFAGIPDVPATRCD